MIKKLLTSVLVAGTFGVLAPAFATDTNASSPAQTPQPTGQGAAAVPNQADGQAKADDAKKQAKAKRIERRQNRRAAKPKTHN